MAWWEQIGGVAVEQPPTQKSEWWRQYGGAPADESNSEGAPSPAERAFRQGPALPAESPTSPVPPMLGALDNTIQDAAYGQSEISDKDLADFEAWQQQTAQIGAQPPAPTKPTGSQADWYNDYYNREMALQSEKGPDFRFQESLDQANAERNPVTRSWPYRAVEGTIKGIASRTGGIMATGLTEAADAAGAENFAAFAKEGRDRNYENSMRREAEQSRMDEQTMLSSLLGKTWGGRAASTGRQAVAAVGEAAAANVTGGGLLGLALYYAAGAYADSRAKGQSSNVAALHASIEGGMTALGGLVLGSGTGRLAGGGWAPAAETAAERLAAITARRSGASIAAQELMEVASASGAETGEEVLTQYGHYMTDVLAGDRKFDQKEMYAELAAAAGPAVLAGGGAAITHLVTSGEKFHDDILQARANRTALARKVESGAPITRGDLEKAGISSNGTNAKSRVEIARKELESIQPPEATNEQATPKEALRDVPAVLQGGSDGQPEILPTSDGGQPAASPQEVQAQESAVELQRVSEKGTALSDSQNQLESVDSRRINQNQLTPPPLPGTVRMYHGGTDYEGGPRWLTPDPNYAEGYANKSEGGKVFYVDIPADSPHLVKLYDDVDSTLNYKSFDAPEEISKQLRPLQSQPSIPVAPPQQGSTGAAGGEPFTLSREGSPGTSPIVEPYRVPDSQRLPPPSRGERQPLMPGMPTDMEPGTLAGQQGLFDHPESATAVAEPQVSRESLAKLNERVDSLREDAVSEMSTVFGKNWGLKVGRAKLGGKRGKDAQGTFKSFDQAVQYLRDNPSAAPNVLAAAERIGDGDIESGLFQVLQGGKAQFATKTADDFLPDVVRRAAAELGDFSPTDDTPFSAKGGLLSPSSPSIQQQPIKSQREIIEGLSKGLGIPIRFGRLKVGAKAGGYFDKIANLIGSKQANDTPVVAHEVGHKLDEVFRFSRNPQIAAELDSLGDPNTPGSRSSWTKSKSRRYRRGEGVAEFVRYWLTDPTHAAQAAPSTHAAFEAALNSNKDVSDVLRQAQDDIRLWRAADPQARLRSHISRGSNPNGTRYSMSQLTRDLVDDLHVLRLATEAAKKNTKGGLAPKNDPYLLARNLRGSYGMAESFIRNGVVDFNTKEVQLGTSLEDALKPVSGRMRDFGDWIVAKRAQELMSQGRETGLVPSDVNAVAAKFDGEPGFQQAFDAVKKWQDALLQYAVDGGLVTDEAAAAMRQMNQDYVPFHRLFEVGAGEPPAVEGQGTGSGLNVGKPSSLRRMKGSTREIVDPLETMVRNSYSIITATEKAAITKAVADLSKLPDMGRWVERVKTPQQRVSLDVEKIREQLEGMGADTSQVPDHTILTLFRPSGEAPFGENIIRVVRDGNEEYYRLDRDLFATFHALDLDDSGKLIKMLSAPAQLLRAGVTLEPGFAVANFLRDTFGAAVISKYGAKPFETTIRGVAAMLNDPQTVADWAAAGGKSSVEANFFDRKKLQRFLAEKIAKDLTPAERALVIIKSPLTALRWLTSMTEEATRIGEYKIAYDSLVNGGMSEGEARRLAAFEARDRQDFAKGGALTKVVRHVTAFWNAELQANVKLAQSFRERPLKTTINGLAYVTLPTLLAMAVNWDDQDYWDRPQWERDAFWLLPVLGKDDDGHTRFVRIPKPFLLGVMFGTTAERMLQATKERRPDAMKGLASSILKGVVPNPMPQSVQLVYEVGMTGDRGWDVYRQREIVPERIADLPSEMQFTEQTSRAAKLVGRTIGVSPMKVDHVISQTTGGVGKVLSGKQIPGERFVTTPLTASNQPTEEFYDALGEMRKQASGDKAGGDYTANPLLPLFEMGAKRLSELRNKSREATEDAKSESENESLKLTKALLAIQRGEKADLPEDFEGRLAYTATQPKPKKKTGESSAKYRERLSEHAEQVNRAAAALKQAKSGKALSGILRREYRRRGLRANSPSYLTRIGAARSLGL